jgi:hypothetical protein
MYIRLRRILQTGITIFSVAGPGLFAGSDTALEVLYAPEAVYTGNPLTFRFRPEPGVPPTVRTNGNAVALPPRVRGAPVEITLYPEEAARVDFLSGTREAWRFDIARPAEKGVLSERDGFLEREGVPVVLLPDHRLPPPLDRRWETLEWLRERFLASTPAIDHVLWIAPGDSMLVGDLHGRISTGKARRLAPADDAWFRVHGYLMAEDGVPADFVAVEMDFHDLDRGMPFHVWIAKWQFFLQRLEHRRIYKDGLMIGPVFDEAHAGWEEACTEALRSLAAAHGLRYVDRAHKPDVWKARLTDQLGKEYKLP